MSDNNVIDEFYTAFADLDAERMAACYHRDVEFSDPVFRGLKGDEARDMWRMLCGRATDLKVTHDDVKATEGSGTAHWDAHYTFNTGRKVHNSIDARFELEDGLIRRHEDCFDLWKWTRMALGVPGVLFGWLPPFQNAVRTKARRQLAAYRERQT